MKSYFLTLLLSFITVCGYSQEINIIFQDSVENHVNNLANTFDYIDEEYDLSSKVKIASFEGISENSKKLNLASLFNSFAQKANSLGANSFTIDESIYEVDNFIKVLISVYYLTPEELNNNFNSYPKNMIYIIGGLNKLKEKGRKIKFNGKKYLLNSLEYIEYQNEIDREATISIGGFLGAKLWIKGKEDRLPKYLSPFGFGLGSGNIGEIGLSVNTGRIYPVQLNIGQFLIHVLNKKQVLTKNKPH
ncbi:hypothetical protein [uncultured Aquimarina sp.]|uniref:hypothetical protein n=1 Tax=uncultured Aquimarina sp. TaxID=575652 RepID=UPI0026320D93|nr:hypothetical protein [uncultured Aquimarina sp.]